MLEVQGDRPVEDKSGTPLGVKLEAVDSHLGTEF